MVGSPPPVPPCQPCAQRVGGLIPPEPTYPCLTSGNRIEGRPYRKNITKKSKGVNLEEIIVNEYETIEIPRFYNCA